MSLKANLEAINSIGLTELDSVKLLNRVDSKFVFPEHQLATILAQIQANYFILKINDKEIFGYQTVYLDNDRYDFYLAHHNGKPNRNKVRYRLYADSNLRYFEIKKRIKDARTDKYRIKINHSDATLQPEELALLAHHQIKDAANLSSKMWINYDRITLVSKNYDERVTLDLNLTFHNNKGNEQALNGLVIAEVKQNKFSRNSPFVSVLRNLNIKETRISKYAIAVAYLNEAQKHHQFKEKIIKLNKIINNGTYRPN